jgi:O-antigen ligase
VTKIVLVVGALVGCVVLFMVFRRWERRGKSHYVVVGLLIWLVVEATLYENENLIPRGIFHPGSGSLQFRLPEVVISLALLARLSTKGWPSLAGVPALLWCAFAAWMTAALVEGILRHNNFTQITYEGKAIIYVVGGYALVSGTRIQRYLEGRVFERLVRWSALLAALLIVMDAAHLGLNVNLPLVPLSNFGALGSDAGTIFASLGLIGLLLELGKARRSGLTLLAVAPLLLSAFLASQRAALLGLGASAVTVLLVALGPTARRRMRVNLTEVTLCALTIVGVVMAVAVIPAVSAERPAVIPFASQVKVTFGSEAKAESAQDRLNQWRVVLPDIRKHLLIGSGLGFEYAYYQPGPDTYVTTDLTHNVGLDLLLRTGLIGLAFFILALCASLRDGFFAWRFHPDRMTGVLSLALLAVIVGLVAKAMVESDLENYRLATFLGISLGLLRAAVTSPGAERTSVQA